MKKVNAILVALAFMICLAVPAFATTETGVRAVKGFPVAGVGHAGSLKTAYGYYDIDSTPADGNIYEMCRIPAGAVIVSGRFYADDLDTGTETLDMDVGWAANGTEAADPNGLLDGGVLTGDAVTGVKPETGTSMPFGGVLITNGNQSVSRETVIQVETNAAPNVFAAGRISVIVNYLMEE